MWSYLFAVLFPYAKTLFAAGFLLSIATYMIPLLYQNMFYPLLYRFQGKLRGKYFEKDDTSGWAIVTGSSSGIGKAIATRLAEQRINVVIAAYPDALLSKTVTELRKSFPDVKFLEVPVNLAKPEEAVAKLAKVTKDLEVRLVFNNAGYLKTGFFASLSVEAVMANYHCNATSVVQITHYFLNRMQNLTPISSSGKRGAIAFTSSPAYLMPCPFSSIYGSTKAFMTEFAASVAPEVRSDGIDFTVVHPSPVATNFYKGAHKLDAIEFFRKTATGPLRIADVLLESVGRCVVRDQGYYPISLRLVLKIVDVCFIGELIALTAHTLKDFKLAKEAAAKSGKRKMKA
eukprot:g3754.t1